MSRTKSIAFDFKTRQGRQEPVRLFYCWLYRPAIYGGKTRYGQAAACSPKRKISKETKAPTRFGAFHISVDSHPPQAQNPSKLAFYPRGFSSLRGVVMQQPRLRRCSVLSCKKVLLIDRCQATCEVRASVLRSHGVEVHTAADLSGARFLWHPNVYQLIMLDVRRYSPVDVLEFWEQIMDASPHERIACLVGPPTYLSFTWPGEVIAEGAPSGQWGETVKRFLAAA
jgi:hypothetical protein